MLTRRAFLAAAGAAAARALWPLPLSAAPLIRRQIPKGGESIPAVGMGTWLTFDVASEDKALAVRAEILRAFFAGGGGMIDSSPMYGSAEAALGRVLPRVDAAGLLSATKVWTPWAMGGERQIEDSFKLWGIKRFDLFQVHNLVQWPKHLKTLRRLKDEGRVRYIGVTTSHGRRHADLARLLKREPLDFVQLTYNMTHRAVEERLLPLAAERGVAVIANRPYDGGALVDWAKRKPLPKWAPEAGMSDWPQFLLKWIVSHPAVTCAIPATSRVAHMRENMAACRGPLPDEKTRARMTKALAAL